MISNLAELRRAELMALAASHDGTLSPAAVVAHASNSTSALHALFTWDDTIAAARWREEQASQYLRAVVTLLPGHDGTLVRVRAFVSLSVERGPGHVYRPIESVMSNDERRAVLLADAKRELAALKVKYAELTELSSVWTVLD